MVCWLVLAHVLLTSLFCFLNFDMDIHLFTDFLSLFVGYKLFVLLNKNKEIASEEKIWYVISAAIGALFFSRLIASLENPYLFLHPINFMYYYENKTIIGAIVGGIVGVEIYKYLNNLKERTGDSVVIPLMVGIIVGRIGCQLKGISDGTIGNPCSYFWCIRAGDSFYRHPLPIYEILFLLLLLPIFYKFIKEKNFNDGVVFRFFIISYFGLRFFLEFLKDTNPIILNLSIIQLVCTITCIYYLYDIISHGLYNQVKAK